MGSIFRSLAEPNLGNLFVIISGISHSVRGMNLYIIFECKNKSFVFMIFLFFISIESTICLLLLCNVISISGFLGVLI